MTSQPLPPHETRCRLLGLEVQSDRWKLAAALFVRPPCWAPVFWEYPLPEEAKWCMVKMSRWMFVSICGILIFCTKQCIHYTLHEKIQIGSYFIYLWLDFYVLRHFLKVIKCSFILYIIFYLWCFFEFSRSFKILT
jgi:hypothetical protein